MALFGQNSRAATLELFPPPAQAMIITRTPFRVSFFGGGTDYPVWYREHGGAVLAAAIDKYCYLSCRHLPPFFEHRSRVIYSKIENVSRHEDIQHPSVRACLQHLGIEDGVEIHHDADLPARTGLGTSSSFTVGLLHALHGLRGRLCDPRGLAEEAIHVEQDLLRENVGAQDQVLAAWGGFNLVRFHSHGAIEVTPVMASAERLRHLQDQLLLCFTGFSRTASEIARHQIAATPKRAAELAEMRALVDEAYAVISGERRSLQEFGRLLDQTWRLKRRLTEQISTSSIDAIYDRGLAAGALGGKLLGAGGGGFLLFFVPLECQAGFRAAMQDLLWVPFRFSSSGTQVVYYQPSEPFTADLTRQRAKVYAQHG